MFSSWGIRLLWSRYLLCVHCSLTTVLSGPAVALHVAKVLGTKQPATASDIAL